MSHDHVEGGSIESAFGYDDVRVALRRLDEFQVHWPDRGLILPDDRLGGPAALCKVALEPADKSQIGIGVDVDFDVEHLSERGFREYQDAFNQDDLAWVHGEGVCRPPVSGEVVDRDLDRPAVAQRSDILDQQFCFEGVGMIEVDFRVLEGGSPLRSL